MKRLIFLLAGAALATVPAVAGLNGNPALSQRVPVRVPSHAVPVRAIDVVPDKGSDHGRRDTDDSSPSPKATSGGTSPEGTSRSGPGEHAGRTTQAGGGHDPSGPAANPRRHAEPGHEGSPAAQRGREAAGPAPRRTAAPSDDRRHAAGSGGSDSGSGSDHGPGHH